MKASSAQQKDSLRHPQPFTNTESRLKRQAVYVYRIKEAHSPNDCCREVTVSIKYFEYVSVYLYSCLRYLTCKTRIFCSELYCHL